jgi:RNA polymerase sigma-70 factor, ECF subfamily
VTARERREQPIKTLGTVLYENQSAPVVVEQDWVALVEAIARGDQTALHALYDRSYRLVFTLVMRITQNRETAEELTVDVFHDVWRRAAGYDTANGTVVGWIMNQARSRAIDRVRFEHRKKRIDPYPHAPAEEGAIDAAVTSGEDRQRLQSALSQLTPDEKQAIECAFFDELTHVEVAKALDAPLGTIKTRIRSGLQKLRAVLGDETEEP